MHIVHELGQLLGTIVFSDSLGGFTYGMLAQFTGQDKTYSSLNLFARDSAAFIVASQFAALMGDAFKNIIHKAIHNGHSLLANVDFWMALAKNFEDVAAVTFMARAFATALGGRGLLNGRLGWCLSGGLLFSFGGHVGW